MAENQSPLAFEKERLRETVALATEQLADARTYNEKNKADIIAAKQDLRENTSHSIANLSGSDGFEMLAELSQYTNAITDKIKDFETLENRIISLENMIKAPYFARIDFKFDDEEDFEHIYIGRNTLEKEDTFERFVYDWRAPIASVFYRFVLGEVYYDAPDGRITGVVNLKRQYEIKDSKLQYFFDTDVQIVDEFLKKLLSQNTSPKMKTIVETIQKEQDLVIRDMESDLMIVQGVAGSGKTSIALHRAAYLMYQGLSTKLSSSNIMIISPNYLFEQYISSVLPELGENNVVSVIFEEIMTTVLKRENLQSRHQFLETIITNTSYQNVIKNSIVYKTSPAFMEILDHFIQDIVSKWIPFEDIYYKGTCVVTKETLKEKVASRPDMPLGFRLEQLEDYILELVNIHVKGRIKYSETNKLKRQIQNFTEINVFHLYRRLMCDKRYFCKLTHTHKLSEDMNAILAFTRNSLNSHMLYYDDAIVLTYLTLKIYGNHHYKRIRQVVIDEAQDYYPLQYEIFKLLFSGSKFTILGDVNQTLEKQETLSLYDHIKAILARKKTALITMDKSFRCTNEILEYSLKFIAHRPEIKSFNRQGEAPACYEAADENTFVKQIQAEIDRCIAKGYQSIGLICKSEKNARSLYALLKESVTLELINSESISDLHGVSIIPVYMSKGLEFDAVLICDVDQTNYRTQEDKNLLYIACTRALHRLNLFCKGRKSALL
jgi:DNA helicase-2/ATP-dependent DNA helicase PcrA